MALTDNKIGVHRFIALRGEVIPPGQTKVIDDRPGVNGSEFVVTGRKGRPFSLVSFVDTDSYADSHQWLVTYKNMVDDQAVELVQGGVSSDANGYRVVVLNVDAMPEGVFPIRGASGNRQSSGAGGFLICRWDLIAVPIEESA